MKGNDAHGTYATSRGSRFTTIAPISYDGLVAAHITTDNFNADEFIMFLLRNIIPVLQPYDGANPNSVVIMGKKK